MRITITAISEKGERALMEDLKARTKAPLHERLLFNRLFDKVVSQNPLKVVLTGKTRFTDAVKPEAYREKFLTGFAAEGCKEGKDFTYKLED